MKPTPTSHLTEQSITELGNEPSVESEKVHFAAIDMGSNSFHMAIAEYDGNSFRIIARHKEKVQLAKGLDSNDHLSESAITRGIECLKRFAERIQDIESTQIRAVATYTLRKATNAQSFITLAEYIIGQKIDILPGKEEARLIYEGVSHNHPDIEKALVIDIGGGSTEIVVGHKFEPKQLESLSLGCVTYNRFFPKGLITLEYFNRAISNASIEISQIAQHYHSKHWQHCLGSSGSIEAVYQVVSELGHEQGYISLEHLMLLKNELLKAGDFSRIHFQGLSSSRVGTFVSGVSILIALFEQLHIERMYVANASLREGVLFSLADSLKGIDIREQSVESMQNRFALDKAHANTILETSLAIYEQVAKPWGIEQKVIKNYLVWACLLHEVGLSINFHRLRHHSSYIVKYADLPGFSQQTQNALASILLNQRKRIILSSLTGHYDSSHALLAVCQILRLSILININRDADAYRYTQGVVYSAKENNGLELTLPNSWQQDKTLIIAELEKERDYLKSIDVELSWNFSD